MSNNSPIAKLTSLRTAGVISAATASVTLEEVSEAVAQTVVVGPFTIPLASPLPVKSVTRLLGEDQTRTSAVKMAHSIVFSGVEGLQRGKIGKPKMETQVFAQLVDEDGETFGMVSISKGYRDGNRLTEEADNLALAVVHSRNNEWTLPSRQASNDRAKVDAVKAATELLNQGENTQLGIYLDETASGNPGLGSIIEDGLLGTMAIEVEGDITAYEALVSTMRVLPKPVAQSASRPGADIPNNAGVQTTSKPAPTAGSGVQVVD
jgi:hypothetical protein